jgi:hypothetical protein
MTLLLNLFQILRAAPQIIGIIKAIIDVVGSAQVQKILESLWDALKKETPPDAIPTSEPERERIVQRVWKRLAFKNLGMSEQEYAHFIQQQEDFVV